MILNGERKYVHLVVGNNGSLTNDGTLEVTMPSIDPSSVMVEKFYYMNAGLPAQNALVPKQYALDNLMKTSSDVIIGNYEVDWTVASWVNCAWNNHPGKISIFAHNNPAFALFSAFSYYGPGLASIAYGFQDVKSTNGIEKFPSWSDDSSKQSDWHHVALCVSSKTKTTYMFVDGEPYGKGIIIWRN